MRSSCVAVVIGALWVAALLLPLPAEGADVARVWLGADKEPLPFKTEDEIVGFLITAREVSYRELSVGITKARKLRLEKRRNAAHVVFHHIDRSEQQVRRLINGNVVMYLRDSYLSQVGAYELGRILGMDNIPPTVVRKSQGERGSAQLWIERAMTEEGRVKKGLEPPSHALWHQYYADMRVFDNLINNIDRNQRNMLVDTEWKLWLIDHTRSFGRDRDLPQPELVTRCSRRLWQALRDWDDAEVEQNMRDYLTPAEVKALLARRGKLVGLIEKRIAESGQETVLFHYGDHEPDIRVSYDDPPTNR